MLERGCWKRRRGGRSRSPEEEEEGGALRLRGVGQELWWGPVVHGALEGAYSKDGGVKLGGECQEPGTGAAHKAQRTRAGEVATCSEELAEEGKALLEVTTHLLRARPYAKHLT